MNLTYEGLVDKFRRTHLSKDLDSCSRTSAGSSSGW
jgi:hypothetical protein